MTFRSCRKFPDLCRGFAIKLFFFFFVNSSILIILAVAREALFFLIDSAFPAPACILIEHNSNV